MPNGLHSDVSGLCSGAGGSAAGVSCYEACIYLGFGLREQSQLEAWKVGGGGGGGSPPA